MVVGPWHLKWQNSFPSGWCKEVTHKLADGRERRADVALLGTSLVVEVQHCRISCREVEKRNSDYAEQGKQVLWLLDGSASGLDVDCRALESGDWLLVFGNPWSFAAFQGTNRPCSVVLVDVGDDRVFALKPADVRRGCVRCGEPLSVAQVLALTGDALERLEPSPKPQYKVYVFQDPPGSGKTYRMVRRCLAPWGDDEKKYEKYDTFLFCTKPHSAKQVVYEEFLAQVEKLKEVGEILGEPQFSHVHNAYRCVLRRARDGQEVEAVFATVDSLVWALGSRNESRTRHSNPFRRICEALALEAPSAVGQHDGFFHFKGQRTSMTARTLVCWDEATKLEAFYFRALLRILLECNADAALCGDLLQSIEVEANTFRQAQSQRLGDWLVGGDVEIVRGNRIRRFGRTLVDFLNDIVRWEKYNLEVPRADEEVEHEDEGSYSVQPVLPMPPRSQPCPKTIRAIVNRVFDAFCQEVVLLLLLPYEVLFVLPHVGVNPVGDELCDRIHEFWLEKLQDADYCAQVAARRSARERAYLEEYLAHPEGRPRRLAYFHRSEANQPIDTSVSRRSTRMVSIHASQGDGRRLAIVVGLSESKLTTFSGGRSDNIVYESLLNVALSRAKSRLLVFVEATYDDVWQRFQSKMLDADRLEAEPVIRHPHLFSGNRFDLAQATDQEELRLDAEASLRRLAPQGLMDKAREVVDYEHHVVRAAAYHCAFFFNIIAQESSDAGTDCRQMTVILESIGALKIQTCKTAKDYYQKLNGEEDKKKRRRKLTCIPLLQDPQSSRGIFEDVFQWIERLQQWLLNVRSDSQRQLLREWPPKVWVLLQHLVDIQRNLRYATTRLGAVFDAFEAAGRETTLDRHYAWLEDAEQCFLRAAPATENCPVEWKISQQLQLSCSKADLNIGVRTQFLAFTPSCATFYVLVPRIDDMNIVEVAGRALLATLLMKHDPQQHREQQQEEENNPARTMALLRGLRDREDNGRFEICIVAYESASPLRIDMSSLLEEHRSGVAAWMVDCVKAQCLRCTQAIEDFLIYHKTPDAAADALNNLRSSNLRSPFYVGRAFERLRNTDKEFDVATRGGPVHEDFQGFLREEMDKALRHLRKSIEGKEEEEGGSGAAEKRRRVSPAPSRRPSPER